MLGRDFDTLATAVNRAHQHSGNFVTEGSKLLEESSVGFILIK